MPGKTIWICLCSTKKLLQDLREYRYDVQETRSRTSQVRRAQEEHAPLRNESRSSFNRGSPVFPSTPYFDVAWGTWSSTHPFTYCDGPIHKSRIEGTFREKGENWSWSLMPGVILRIIARILKWEGSFVIASLQGRTWWDRALFKFCLITNVDVINELFNVQGHLIRPTATAHLKIVKR